MAVCSMVSLKFCIRTAYLFSIPDSKLLAFALWSGCRLMGEWAHGVLAEGLVCESCPGGKDWMSVAPERAWTSAVCGPPQVKMNLTWAPSRLQRPRESWILSRISSAWGPGTAQEWNRRLHHVLRRGLGLAVPASKRLKGCFAPFRIFVVWTEPHWTCREK